MPSSLVGLLVLLLAGTPGYLYLFCYERRALRDVVSPAREIAELFAVGASSTLAAALVILSVAELWSALLPLAGFASGLDYMAHHPWQTLTTAGAVLVLSAAICAGLGHLLGGRSPYAARYRIQPGGVWHGVLTAPCIRNVRGAPVEARRFVAIHLIDGLRIEGYFDRISHGDDVNQRDIALSRPIALTPPGGLRRRSKATTVIVPGALIRFVETGAPPVRDPATPN